MDVVEKHRAVYGNGRKVFFEAYIYVYVYVLYINEYTYKNIASPQPEFRTEIFMELFRDNNGKTMERKIFQ